MGEMVEALGLEETVVPATLALFSVSQMAARVVTGVVSEATLPYVSRPFYLVVASLVGVASHVGLALVTDQGSFVVFCTLSGVAFGMSWPLMVLIVGEVFGVKHHGGNYMLYDGGTKALGTLLLGTYVAGTFYERHTTPENPLVCHGAACFRGTHWIVAALSVTGVVASLVLQYTSRHVYKMGHDKEERV
jgi:MFS family permease